MESRFFTIASQKNPLITIRATTGHFATGSSHISHYIDISELKSSSAAAKNAARELAMPYLSKNIVDVIVCMEGTEIIAAYLADELLQPGLTVMNEGDEIYVVTPKNNSSGHFIFHENIQKKIANKNVVLVVASVSTGATIHRAVECLCYYGGNLIGISAVFSAVSELDGWDIHSLFTCDDVPEYKFARPSQCEICQSGNKLDAIIDSEGYTRI
jgi:orotate phosphoribosyltransferase